MIEVLPIKVLNDEDAPIFGKLNVALGKLYRADLPVASGIVIVPPEFKLKTVLEHYDFGSKEIFEQSLTLVKKEIKSIPLPEQLLKETSKEKLFLVEGVLIRSVKHLWFYLLESWLEEVKERIWKKGFYQGITEGLDPKIVSFVKKVEGFGLAFFDSLQDDVVINIKDGKIHPNDQKKLVEFVRLGNKKLFIPHQYEWIIDHGLKIVRVLPFTPTIPDLQPSTPEVSDHSHPRGGIQTNKSAVKVFLDLSNNLSNEKDIDGVFIPSEKIFDLNKPRESFENLVFRLVESATTFPNSPVLFKLADKSEGMGKVRGTLRLLHQQSLFQPMVDALDFARHKKGLNNVHVVIPFVRGVNELLQIKRELAVKKLMRKNSLQLWMEVCIPENIVNLEEYLITGIDGVVLNLDELISHLNGFDSSEGELIAYKNEVSGLLKFLEDGLKLLHKSKVPFIAYGSLSLYPKVLEFLVEKGVYGIVVEKYEAHSIKDLLYQTERRMVLKRLV